jgi:hypothetical protein
MKLKAQTIARHYQGLKAELSDVIDLQGKVDFLNNLRRSKESFIKAKQESNHSSLWTLREWRKDMDNNIKAIQLVIQDLTKELYNY